jgi:hypothetical protein
VTDFSLGNLFRKLREKKNEDFPRIIENCVVIIGCCMKPGRSIICGHSIFG